MIKRKKEQTTDSINLLTLIPNRRMEWQENSDGKIELLKPKFSIDRIQKFFSKMMKQTHFKIKLDDVGSSVWKLIDGKKTVEEIGGELQQQFGADIEPVFDRLGQFIGQLPLKIYFNT